MQALHERGEVRAKLGVSDPSDASEREAERVAEEVVRMPDPEDEEIVRMADSVDDVGEEHVRF